MTRKMSIKAEFKVLTQLILIQLRIFIFIILFPFKLIYFLIKSIINAIRFIFFRFSCRTLSVEEYQITLAKRKYLEMHPVCEICDIEKTFFGKNNDVHHKKPVHLFKELATNLDNLITLCRLHHWLVGHYCNWKYYNPNIDNDVNNLKKIYTNFRDIRNNDKSRKVKTS